MDNNSLNIFNSGVEFIQAHPQNINFEMNTNFLPVNPTAVPMETDAQMHLEKMTTGSILQQGQEPTYYWNEYPAAAQSNLNWTYTYPNYSLPQAPVAVPVGDFTANQETELQQSTTLPAQLSFQPYQPGSNIVEVTPNNSAYQHSVFYSKEQNFQVQTTLPPSVNPSSYHQPFPGGVINSATTFQPQNVVSPYQHVQVQNANFHQVKQEFVGPSENGIPQNNHGVANAVEKQSLKKPRKRNPKANSKNSIEAPPTPQSRTSKSSRESSGFISQDSVSSEAPSSSGTSKGEFSCPVCNKTYSQKHSLRRHTQVAHSCHSLEQNAQVKGKKSDFKCDVCGKFFCNMCSLKRHQKDTCRKSMQLAETHQAPIINFNATLGSATGVTNGNVMGNKNKKIENEFYQNLPGTNSLVTTQIDEETSVPSNGKRYNRLKQKLEGCHLCNKCFSTKNLLQKHISRVHAGATQDRKKQSQSETKQVRAMKRESEVSESGNLRRSSLEDNNQDDSSKLNQVVQCEICHNDFQSAKSLRSHMSTAHKSNGNGSDLLKDSTSNSPENSPAAGGKELRNCEICKKVLNRAHFRRHMLSAHKLTVGEADDLPQHPKSTCKYCKAVMLKGNLPRHMRSHHKLEYDREKELQGSPSGEDTSQHGNNNESPEASENTMEYSLNEGINPETSDAHQYPGTWTESGFNPEMETEFKHFVQNNPPPTGDGALTAVPNYHEASMPDYKNIDMSNNIAFQSNELHNSDLGTLNYGDLGGSNVPPSEDIKPDTEECPICERMIIKSELWTHKTNHELICHICGKDDVRLPEVSAHGTTHVSSIICEICGHKAQAKVKLWEHMNSHFRVRPLICLECGWSFGNTGSMQYHIKAQHSGASHKCEFCEKTFVTEQAKQGHELSHYGTTCPFCKEEFERKKDLGEHIKMNHKRRGQMS